MCWHEAVNSGKMAMSPFSKIALVIRTIGAARGLAARGRPLRI